MRLTSRISLFFLFLISTCSVLSQPGLNELLPLDPALKTGKLENGLTYYIRTNKKPEKKVELRLVVNVGSILEDDDQQGLAHMCEHMAFNGTKNFKKNEIVSFLQDIGVGFGVDLNAYTGFDETVYILPIPTDKPGNLEKAFQVLEDWAHQVTYLDEDINNERGVILEESRSGKSGEERMFRKIYPELFKGSKYADRLPIGVDSIIKNFKPDVIRRFYHEWYRPNLMSVVIVGDISQADAMALIDKHFSGIQNPQSQRARDYAMVPPYPSTMAMVATDKEATSYNFSLNYSAYPVKPSVTLGNYRDDLVKKLYTSMLNSRFREISQKENAPFVYAFVGFDSYAKGYESFNADVSTGTNDIRKGEDALTEEIQRVKQFGFTSAELNRAKKNMLSSYERMWNNRDKNESQNYADEYIRNFTEREPSPGIDNEFNYVKQMLPGITLEELNKLTDTYKNEHNRFAYIMGPESSPGTSTPTNAEILAILDNKEKSTVIPYEEKAVASAIMPKAPVAGKVLSRSVNPVLGTTELKLSNGISVTLKITDFKADQVLLSGNRQGGIGKYGLPDRYSAENAASLVATMGIGEFSPTDLRKALAGKTATVIPQITQTTDGFRGSSSNKDMETMFQLLSLYVTSPRKDTSLFRSFIQRNKTQFTLMGANPQAAFIDTVYKVLYQNNPMAPTTIPKSENYDKISLDRAMKIYNERLGDMSGMHFIIVGSFRENEILPLIEKYVASLPAGREKFTFTDNKVRPFSGKNIFTFQRGKEDKSLILAVYEGETPYSPTFSMKLSGLSEIINIKIIEEMREKIQGIYGGGTFNTTSKIPYPSYQFVLQLPCGPAKVDTLLKEFYRELDMLANHGPEPGYLDKVKKQWLEGYRTDMKTNEFWLTKLSQIQMGESFADWFIHWDKYVGILKPSHIQAVAKMVRDAPTRLIAIQMPEKK